MGELIGDGCAGGGGRSKTARARASRGQGQGEGGGEGGGTRTANPALLVPDATVVTLGDGTNHVLPLRRLWALCVVASKQLDARRDLWQNCCPCEIRRVGVWERNGGGAERVFR